MVIWQAMKGHYQNPKRVWNHHDLKHQHFTESTGRHFRNKVKKDDLMLIYLPGTKAFIGLQKAAEDGPYELSPSILGADLWPWGLKVKDHIWIPYLHRAIGLHESKTYLPERPHPVRPGLARVGGWGSQSSIQSLIDEIRKRGEDPSKWKTWPRSL